MPKGAWLVISVATILTLGLLVGLRAWRGQRQAEFRALAAELGLTWVAADDVALRRQLAGFELFAPVAASRADGLLTGSYDGIPVSVMNYDYGNFLSSGLAPYIVVIFSPDPARPDFYLRPRGALNSLPPAVRATEALADFPDLSGYDLTGSPERSVLAHCAQNAAQGRWPAAACQDGALIYYETLRARPNLAALHAILAAGEEVYRALLAAQAR